MDIAEDLVVVGPSRRGDVDSGCRFGNEFGHEESSQMNSAGAGDGLEGDCLSNVG